MIKVLVILSCFTYVFGQNPIIDSIKYGYIVYAPDESVWFVEDKLVKNHLTMNNYQSIKKNDTVYGNILYLGAESLIENKDSISCKLTQIPMVYYFKETKTGSEIKFKNHGYIVPVCGVVNLAPLQGNDSAINYKVLIGETETVLLTKNNIYYFSSICYLPMKKSQYRRFKKIEKLRNRMLFYGTTSPIP